jgi:hypothetical protein
MPKEWERSLAVIAQRIGKGQIPGFFRKQIVLKENEQGFLESNGEIHEEFSQGMHTVNFEKGVKDLILVDKSEKKLTRIVEDLWTRDDKKINSKVEIVFKVYAPDKLFKNLLGVRSSLLLDDIWSQLCLDKVSKILTPAVKQKDLEQLCGGGKTAEKIEKDLQENLEDLLKQAGIELRSVSVFFSIPEEYEEFLKKRGVNKETLRSLEMQKEMEFGEEETFTREEKLDELEKLRVEKEVKMQLEKEETQRDFEDALEALKLKDLKNKQKLLKEIQHAKTQMKPDKKDVKNVIESLTEKISELENAKEIVEKKFYKKELSEEAFNKMMENYEQKIIELETKIEGLKKKG